VIFNGRWFTYWKLMDFTFADQMADDVPVFKDDAVGTFFNTYDRIKRQAGLIDIDGRALLAKMKREGLGTNSFQQCLRQDVLLP